MSTVTYIGRFVPSSAEDFGTYAKNLAKLLGLKLSAGRDLLAQIYGFAHQHEAVAFLKSLGTDSPRSPYLPVRVRPDFLEGRRVLFDKHGERIWKPDPEPNTTVPLTPWESGMYWKAYRYVFDDVLNYEGPDEADPRLSQEVEHFGLMRRRVLSLLECGFFSAPSAHRKAFRATLAAIEEMEAGGERRQRQLYRDWPPGMWAYLELRCQSPIDAGTKAELAKLVSDGSYFTKGEWLESCDAFKSLPSYSAPHAFLVMTGVEDIYSRKFSSLESAEYQEISSNLPNPDVSPNGNGLFMSDEYLTYQLELLDINYNNWPEELIGLSTAELITSESPYLSQADKAKLISARFNSIRDYCVRYSHETRYTQLSLDNSFYAPRAGLANPSTAYSSELVPMFTRLTPNQPAEYYEVEPFVVLDSNSVVYLKGPDGRDKPAAILKGHHIILINDGLVPDTANFAYYFKTGSPIIKTAINAIYTKLLPSTGYESIRELMIDDKEDARSIFIGELWVAPEYSHTTLYPDVIRAYKMGLGIDHALYPHDIDFETDFGKDYHPGNVEDGMTPPKGPLSTKGLDLLQPLAMFMLEPPSNPHFSRKLMDGQLKSLEDDGVTAFHVRAPLRTAEDA